MFVKQNVVAQDFLNNDLNGIISANYISVPTSWQSVPYTDINCQSSWSGGDTPDILGLYGPSPSAGLNGNPYSGNTFASGLFTDSHHEGIMQTVHGFTVGCSYSINFFQANVKSSGHIDTSGSWAVYIDNTLLNISAPTISHEPYNSNSFIWEYRSFNFTASSNSHTIKFLPADDDSDHTSNSISGQLRMGIDSIYIKPTYHNILGNDTALCQGEIITLNATVPNATYIWQDNSSNPTFNVTQQGSYWVEITVNNCSTIDTINISYNLSPTINLGNDTTLCQGETLILNSTTSNATYLWQDNSSNSTFNVTQQGTYWTEITSRCGVIANDTININYNFITINLGNDSALCQGETLLLDATTSSATYLWQDNSTNSTFNVTQQGTYWIEITVNNCTLLDTITINTNPKPTVNLGYETTLCQGETLILDVTTSNASYLWQNNSTNPVLNVTDQGTYWVELIVNNCRSSDSILIITENCEVILEIPNIFTPNNDAVNDLFVPIISKGVVSMNTSIFDRWGNRIYETDKLLIEWNGQDVNDGTYFWIVYYTDINGVESNLKGYVTLLKN